LFTFVVLFDLHKEAIKTSYPSHYYWSNTMENVQFAQSTMNSNYRMKADKEQVEQSWEGTIWKLLLLSAVAYLVWSDRIDVVFNMQSPEAVQEQNGQAVKASIFNGLFPEDEKHEAEMPPAMVELPPGDMDNLTLAIDPGYARRYDVPQVEMRLHQENCRRYIRRFAPVAIAEMKKFGIPASITLAQALLESNAGQSKLAEKANNHFGLKCFDKRCKRGHCINHPDNTHKDFFVSYPNVWGSFRAHSKLLSDSDRYQSLFELGKHDFRAWANGLEQAGYATDELYAEKLIAIIQNLKLYKFDRMTPD
jgi:flagellum-specific peptidoglycan hydrolase FlgJ